MKRILYTAAVICLSFLAAQCTKDIDELQEVEGQKVEIGESYMEMTPGGQVHMYLGISGGSDGATRTTIADASSSGVRAVSWNKGDKIYVVSSAESEGCLGYLEAKNSGVVAAFEGTLNSWSGTQTLHYYYVGSNNSITNGATSYSYSIASQDGTLDGIAANHQLMHASMADMTAGSNKLLSLTMENLMAIGWFDLTTYSEFSGAAVTLTAGASATLDLTAASLGTPSSGAITLTNPSSNYYIALIPGSQAMAFSDGTSTINFDASSAIVKNKLYTDGEYAMTLAPEYVDGSNNYGHGYVIADIVWAPVNCGQDADNPTGKLYQWGKIHGHSRTGSITRYNGHPTYAEGVAQTGFVYQNGYESWYSDCSTTDTWPSDQNPCPDGWRVPKLSELTALVVNKDIAQVWKEPTSAGGYSDAGQYFYRNSTAIGSNIFLSANGIRYCFSGDLFYLDGYTNKYSCYFGTESKTDVYGAGFAIVSGDIWATTSGLAKGHGANIRCVRKTFALSGEFSVSETKKVEFSGGNLYYDGSTFKFEDNQYAYTASYDANHVCRFRWAANNGTLSSDISTAISTETSLSGAATDVFFTNATLTTPRAGFTVEGAKGVWRTLSGGSSGEWEYLLDTRAGMKAPDINGNTDCRYAYAKVNGICGMLIFPDTFTWPSGAGSIPGTFNGPESNWNSVNYTVDQFALLESAGCVFLPAAGLREGATISSAGLSGCYSSATPSGTDLTYSHYLLFSSAKCHPTEQFLRYPGYSVRLVRDVN